MYNSIFKIPFFSKFIDGKSKVQLDLQIDIVKAFFIVSFLLIIIPFGKLAVANGLLIFFTLVMSFDAIFRLEFEVEILTSFVLSIAASIGTLLILFEKRGYNIAGICIQYIYLGCLLSYSTWKEIKDIALLISVSIYFLLTFILILHLSYKNKLNLKY